MSVVLIWLLGLTRSMHSWDVLGVVLKLLLSQWAAVDMAISKEGWKLITLLRLSPIIPWNIMNYAVSVTGMLQ